MKNKFQKLALAAALLALTIQAKAAAVAPDVSGIVDDGATVAYAAVGIAIVLTVATIAIRASRRWVK